MQVFSEKKYEIFNKYILRTPLFSVNYFFELTKEKYISCERLKKEFGNPIIKESIYLASPILFFELTKLYSYNNTKIKDKDKEKIRNSFLKYLSRLSSRCTPFGLFAGSCLGSFANKDKIVINEKNHGRNTKLDMNVTGLIIKNLEKNEHLKKQLLFYPNNSIYYVGSKIRYVESTLVAERLSYQIIEIDNSEYLKKIFDLCDEGLIIDKLSDIIVDSDVDKEDAIFYINELINNQILVSEIQQTVSGDESLVQLLKVLEKKDCPNDLIEKLKLIEFKIKELDFKLGNDINKYKEISSLINILTNNISAKYLFQTNLFTNPNINCLNNEIGKNVISCLEMLNKISFLNENKDIINFKNQFINRYENREMPLSFVLDNENGIGYPVKSNVESNTLIEGLSFNINELNLNKKLTWTPIQTVLLNKILNALNKNFKVLKIDDDDIKDLNADWTNLPATFTALVQIVKLKGEDIIVMSEAGGSSATNLLGRFCHGNYEINNFVQYICDHEEKHHLNKILAEIVHLPEDRIGNVLVRPSFRNYEIPYLSHSLKPRDKQIKIDDILISIKNDKIFLKSKINGLEIIPILSNAHTFSSSILPTYRFLCDLQLNEKRNFLGIDTTFFDFEFNYLPRITYKKVILSLAKWIINSLEIKDLMKIKDENLFNTKLSLWQKEKNLPQYIYFVEGDNKLLVNMSNISSVKMFFALATKLNRVVVHEFLFEEKNNCVNSNNEHYVNEFIFTFYCNMPNIN